MLPSNAWCTFFTVVNLFGSLLRLPFFEKRENGRIGQKRQRSERPKGKRNIISNSHCFCRARNKQIGVLTVRVLFEQPSIAALTSVASAFQYTAVLEQLSSGTENSEKFPRRTAPSTHSPASHATGFTVPFVNVSASTLERNVQRGWVCRSNHW